MLFHLCGEKIYVAKAQSELKSELGRTVGDSKKGFQKYVNSKRQCRNNICHEDGHVTNWKVDRAERFNGFFTSVFNTGGGFLESQCPELEDHDCENDKLSVNPSLVQDLHVLLNPSKSVRPDGVHPRVLKELADVITRPFSMILEWSQESEKVPINWNLTNALVFQRGPK